MKKTDNLHVTFTFISYYQHEKSKWILDFDTTHYLMFTNQSFFYFSDFFKMNSMDVNVLHLLPTVHMFKMHRTECALRTF